jgi:hypothetical protein
VFVAKLDTDGVWQWAVSAGGTSDDLGAGIAVDTNGNAYITGYYEGTTMFGNTTLVSQGWWDVFVAKVDIFGVWQWATSAGGTSLDDGRGVSVDMSGNAFITGWFTGSMIFGPFTLVSQGDSDVFVAKLSSGSINQPPGPPFINGPTSGKPGKTYYYTFVSVDPEGDPVYYEIDWGDGTPTIWYGPHGSDVVITRNHTWNQKGTYNITARAKDVHGATGDRSYLSVTMPCAYTIPRMQLWARFFQQFPNAFRLLRHLMGYETPSFSFYHLFTQKNLK